MVLAALPFILMKLQLRVLRLLFWQLQRLTVQHGYAMLPANHTWSSYASSYERWALVLKVKVQVLLQSVEKVVSVEQNIDLMGITLKLVVGQ